MVPNAIPADKSMNDNILYHQCLKNDCEIALISEAGYEKSLSVELDLQKMSANSHCVG